MFHTCEKEVDSESPEQQITCQGVFFRVKSQCNMDYNGTPGAVSTHVGKGFSVCNSLISLILKHTYHVYIQVKTGSSEPVFKELNHLGILLIIT